MNDKRGRKSSFLRFVSFLELLALAVLAGWSYTNDHTFLVALSFCFLGARSCSKNGLIEEVVSHLLKTEQVKGRDYELR